MKSFRLKKVISALFIFTSLANLYSQIQLSEQNVSWTRVLSGESITQPELTSYGFLTLTDGKNIEAVSNSGSVIWDKYISGSGLNSKIKVLRSDLTVCVTNSTINKVNLINPSGHIIWTRELDFQVTETPLEGRDGRFFLRGFNKAACMGPSGILKWYIETPVLSDIPTIELPDGSLLFFLAESSFEDSKALRISPFGEIIEDLSFSGEIISAVSSHEELYVLFSDGSYGAYILTEKSKNSPYGNVREKWHNYDKNINSSKKNFLTVSSVEKKQPFIVSKSNNGITITTFDISDGTITQTLNIHEIDINTITLFKCMSSGDFFVSDRKNAFVCNSDGILLWDGKLPKDSAGNENTKYLCSEDNKLIVINENWTCNAWTTIQSTAENNYVPAKRNYNNWYRIEDNNFFLQYEERIPPDLVSKERIKSLQDGNYGPAEAVYYSELASIIQTYVGTLTQKTTNIRETINVFQKDSNSTIRLFNQLSLFDTGNVINLEKQVLLTETNSMYLVSVLTNIAKQGYDPDGELLSAIEVLQARKFVKYDSIYDAMCEAIFSICIYMGKPAFEHKGKVILTKIMYSSSNIKTKEKARNTLKRIADAGI